MGELTNGQKLLTALQSSEHARQERYSETLDAKRKAARDKLLQGGANPKHSRNHLLVFDQPEPQVHSLLPDVAREQPTLLGIHSMLASKAIRHEAAWQQYVASKELARQQHHQVSAAAAAALAARIKSIAADVEHAMSVLAEDQVMVLDKQQVLQVWDTVMRHCSTTGSWINGLGTDLQAAETDMQQSCQTALQAMVSGMCEIAHLDEGRVQRLMEQEVMALNMELLDNRQVAAEMLQQLHAQQVQQEQVYRQRWEAAFAAWRTLCSKHTVHQYNQRLRAELYEPADRLRLYAQLKGCQEEAHAKLVLQCRQAGQLTPPHLTSAAVASWVSEAMHWSAQWQQQVSAQLQQLQQQEEETEQQVQGRLQDLRAEVLKYEGYAAAQVEELLQQEAQPVVNDRREAAAQLLQGTTCFLQRQAAEWQLAVQVLGSWLSSLVALFEDHKSSIKRAEAGIRATLKAARQEFEQADADREAALDAAILSVIQGSSEKVLDQRVDAALRLLSAIEAGYRAYAAASAEKVREYPGVVKQRVLMYRQCLCGLLHTKPQVHSQTGSPQPPDATAPSSEVLPQQQPLLDTPQGGAYFVLDDLWTALMGATDKPWMQHLHAAPGNSAAQSSSTADFSLTTAKAPTASTNGGKLTAQQQAEAAAAAAAAEAAAAALGAQAAAAHAAAVAAAAAFPPCPVAQNGSALCLHLTVPDAIVQTSLQQLQVSLLSEMESYSGRVQGSADTWAESVEDMLTEELDSRLRAHRPRAGRIEEEVRAARSIKLLAQRRHVENHMRCQSRAVKDQQAMFNDSVMQLRSAAEAWVAKIAGYDRLLANALSLKGIDICWREAQALKAKQDRQLHEKVTEISREVVSSCSSVVEVNRRFQTEQLKLFEEGGTYAADNVTTYRAGIASINHHMTQQQQQQQQQLASLQQELSCSLSTALAAVEQLLPSFKQDMTLLDTVNKLVEGAKKKASAELGKNSLECEAIVTTLHQLQDALTRAAEQQRGTDQACSSADCVRNQALLQECQQVLVLVNKLRQQMLKQGQVLELLQSPGLVNSVISLKLTTELQPMLAVDAPITASSSSPSTVVQPADSAGSTKGAAARPGTGQKGGRPESSGAPGRSASPGRQVQSSAPGAAVATAPAEGGAQSVEAAAVPLAKDVIAVIDAAKQEVEVAAKAYYASKDAGRPIRYPDRIASNLKDLMAGVDMVLLGLQQMLQQHVVAATKQLRVQVVLTRRLLERVPDAVMLLLVGHLLSSAEQQRRKLLAEFICKRQVLEQQLESNKRHLQPGMLHPNRRLHFEGLRSSEASRQTAAAELTASCASQCLALISSQAKQVSAAVDEVCKLLLCVLDGMVMPADLAAGPAGDDALAGLQQRTMQELQRLALAQQEAEPAGPAAAPPPAAAPSIHSSKAGAKPTGKTAGGDMSGANGDGGAPARPFPYVHWRLSAGNISLTDWGWLAADQQVIMGSLTSTNQPATGQPTTPPSAAGTTASLKSPAAANAVAAAGSQQIEQNSQASGTLVTGYDTPCQRAVIQAQQACLCRLERALTAAVSELKQQLYQWVRQEQLWQSAWAQMVEELDTV